MRSVMYTRLALVRTPSSSVFSRTLRRPPVRGRRAQRKFLDLGGSAENQGDLKSVVLHKMTLSAQKSTFPIALGVRITAVDDNAYSQTGESYSMITMPNADSHVSRVLQEDNTDLAYEAYFAKTKPTLCLHAPLTWHCVCARSLRASSLATLPRVRAAFEQTKARAHTHTRTHTYASSRCAQTWTRRASMRRVRACSTPSTTRSHALSRTHTSTDTHALRRRSPRAASASSLPVRLSPTTPPAGNQLKHRASCPSTYTCLHRLHRSPSGFRD